MDWVFGMFFFSVTASALVALAKGKTQLSGGSPSEQLWVRFNDECRSIEQMLQTPAQSEELMKRMGGLRNELSRLDDIERSRGEIVFNSVRLRAATHGLFID